MVEYEKLIENLAKNRESMMYYNSGPDHAAIVFSKIFKYAHTELCILAGNMKGGISNQSSYLSELRQFLERKGQVKLLLREFDKKNNPELFQLLSKYQFLFPDQVEVKIATSVLTDTETSREIHICTGDSSIYRIEEDIEKYTAKGSFNDPLTTQALNRIFAEMFESASPVALN
jgi:hypothetical protein